ncbi:uncharacterized protein LY79DRAFT_584951 [Colletotrichum navitas]|uniref:Uncharacterized protein n=1 Tax=Colletotrichum navitas TaxID=681940 RepID=A0AAD8PJX1_9PEZI|nr:uncharacterized protein LY79DRAFT_584951 [Colletotrichum navitas]KAK1566205.1 hypothetical protein LY79DRAFT_584951 [Colletotrichum navitas]
MCDEPVPGRDDPGTTRFWYTFYASDCSTRQVRSKSPPYPSPLEVRLSSVHNSTSGSFCPAARGVIPFWDEGLDGQHFSSSPQGHEERRGWRFETLCDILSSIRLSRLLTHVDKRVLVKDMDHQQPALLQGARWGMLSVLVIPGCSNLLVLPSQ